MSLRTLQAISRVQDFFSQISFLSENDFDESQRFGRNSLTSVFYVNTGLETNSLLTFAGKRSEQLKVYNNNLIVHTVSAYSF